MRPKVYHVCMQEPERGTMIYVSADIHIIAVFLCLL